MTGCYRGAYEEGRLSWQGKKVLVTGAGGFIGSHLAERLVREGAEVRALVHYNALGRRGWLDGSELAGNMEIVAGDVTDAGSVRAAMRGASHVFHLAALIAIPYSYRAVASYVRTNVEGTLNVLQAALDLKVERLVHTSTSETYGTARYAPIDEAHPAQAQSPYAASKVAADQLALSFHRSFDLPVAVLRPFNTYGPRQSARAVIPTVITQCLIGKTVKLGSLHPTRDLLFVTDTVEGFLAAGSAERAVGEAVHIGSGREISIGDLAQLIARLVGGEIEIRSETERVRPERSEVERLLADASRAEELLDWRPRTALEDGLGITISWIREHLDAYRPGTYAV